MRSIGEQVLAEVIGTFALVFIGAGAVVIAAAGASTLLGVALAHGLVLAVMVSSFGHISGGHFNPAVTISAWVAGKIETVRAAAYVVAQLVGAIAAGLAVWAFFAPMLARFEAREGLVRGLPGSEKAAMIFGQYFPNAAMFGTGPDAQSVIRYC